MMNTRKTALPLKRSAAILALLVLMCACSLACAQDVIPPVLLTPQEGEFFSDSFTAEGTWPDYRPDGKLYGYEFDYWQGCSVWCAVAANGLGVQCTSFLAPQGAYSYEPGNLIDGDRSTAWVEGAEGYGIGESILLDKSITLIAEENLVTYKGICIVNGYARSEQTWRDNSRVKRLIVHKDDQYLCDLLLKDTMKPQYFDLTGLNLEAASGEEVHFRFLIADVWPGDKYADTALTGIEIEFLTPNH